MLAGFDSGFKFVINLLREIKSLTAVKGSGFPETMLINSLDYLYQSVVKLERGSLYNVDQMSFTIDANLNEARAFLLSVLEDPTSSPKAVELAGKTIFLLGLARSSVEDLLLTASHLDKDKLSIDLREELQKIKIIPPPKDAPVKKEESAVEIGEETKVADF
jgi:hypothetical protein